MPQNQPLILRSRPKFEAILAQFPELRLQKSFPRQYQAVVSYYERQMEGEIPRLVRKIEQMELKHLYEEIHGGPPAVRIESMKDVHRLLGKYPQEKENNHFDKRYRYSKIYFKVRDYESHSQKELAEIHSISQQRISEYLSGKEPTLVSRLRQREVRRLIEEWCLTKLFEYKMDVGLENKENSGVEAKIEQIARKPGVTRIEETLLGFELGFSLENIISLLSKIFNKMSEGKTRIAYTTLEALEIPKLHRFVKFLEKHHEKIRREIWAQTNLVKSENGVHICVVDRRLYLWIPNMAPNNMINAWSNQWFYFNRSDLARIILMVVAKLELAGSDYEKLGHFKNLVAQLISREASNHIGLGDYKSKLTRLIGDVFHLQCDILGVSPCNLERIIKKVTGKNGHGGILHPKLLHGEKCEILQARLGAIVNSDCWLAEDGRLQYTEADIGRIQIVQALFRHFGDIDFRLVPSEVDKSYKMWIPKPIGHAFIFWGFTIGDKSVQNERLVESIRNGSVELKIAYLEELIAEDGSFEPLAGFRWSRTIVLNPGTRDLKYHVQPKLSESEASFVLNHDASRIDEKRKHVIVPISKIEKQSNSRIARKILNIIETNRSQLLDDEVALVEGLGIEMIVYPEHITVYEETKRISLKWVAKTKSKIEAIKWALLAPPNCSRKKKNVESWLAARPEEVVRVQKQLQLKELHE